MGLTNWQLFFQDLQNSTTIQPTQDTEVLTVVRQMSDTVMMTDVMTPVVGSANTAIGTATIGFGEIG